MITITRAAEVRLAIISTVSRGTENLSSVSGIASTPSSARCPSETVP